MKSPERQCGGATQGPGQFQLEGDAAERYERWTVPFLLGPWAPGLLDLAALRVGERVLDVATGTGVVARLAARRVAPAGTVTGLDLNQGMLEVARRLPLPPGLTIDWRQGSAASYPSRTEHLRSCSANKGCSFSRIDRRRSARCAAS
jgi:2-polyprenyl-3-methyl-5-hydroxy-6-metoxy-1,4-benzoquinol methylase